MGRNHLNRKITATTQFAEEYWEIANNLVWMGSNSSKHSGLIG